MNVETERTCSSCQPPAEKWRHKCPEFTRTQEPFARQTNYPLIRACHCCAMAVSQILKGTYEALLVCLLTPLADWASFALCSSPLGHLQCLPPWVLCTCCPPALSPLYLLPYPLLLADSYSSFEGGHLQQPSWGNLP